MYKVIFFYKHIFFNITKLLKKRFEITCLEDKRYIASFFCKYLKNK